MNRNAYYFIVSLSVISCNADTEITSKNGEIFNFGQWSKQTAVNAPSKDGSTKLNIQSCYLKKDHGGFAITNVIDAVFNPSGNEMFLGQRATSYALVDGKVLALYSNGVTLKVGKSKTVGSAPRAFRLLEVPFLKGLWTKDASLVVFTTCANPSIAAHLPPFYPKKIIFASCSPIPKLPFFTAPIHL